MGCGVWTKGQMVFLGGVPQVVEDHARLHSRNASRWIDLGDLRHVPGEIEHHSDIAALSGEGGPAAPAEDGSAIFTSQGDGRNDIVGITGKNHSDGNLAIVGSVGGVKGAA